MAKEVNYCGCCGREYTGRDDLFCDDCLPHLATRGAAHDRTYFAQYGVDCPYQVPMVGVDKTPKRWN